MKSLLTCLSAILALSAPATAQEWSRLTKAHDFGRGAIGCDSDGSGVTGNYFCLALHCRDGGQAQIALLAAGADFGDGAPVPVYIDVDGKPVASLTMTPSSTSGQLIAETPYDAAAHGPLISALQSGRTAQIALFRRAGFVDIPLRGSSRALGHALKVCGAAQATKAPSGNSLSAADIRNQLIGKRLTWADGAVGTVYFPDGHYEGVMEGRANNGRYEVTSDGRLCWQAGLSGNSGITGCFRFHRKDGVLRIRRDDAKSSADLGAVSVE